MPELEEKIKSLLDSPDGMSRILETAQSIFGGSAETEDAAQEEIQSGLPALNTGGENLFESLDPKVVSTAMQMMSEYRKSDDRRIQLLKAMRSYFKEEDQIHITKAIQIVKLSKVAKQAFRSMREEDMFV